MGIVKILESNVTMTKPVFGTDTFLVPPVFHINFYIILSIMTPRMPTVIDGAMFTDFLKSWFSCSVSSYVSPSCHLGSTGTDCPEFRDYRALLHLKPCHKNKGPFMPVDTPSFSHYRFLLLCDRVMMKIA